MRLSAEHATIELAEPGPAPRVGDRVEFVVGYNDSIVCLHDEVYGARGGRVEEGWPNSGRGRGR